MRRGIRWRYVLAGLAVSSVLVYAQVNPGQLWGVEPNPSYDGRFAFVRLHYVDKPNDPCTGRDKDRGPGWRHDYPKADRSLMNIVTQMTHMSARTDSVLILRPTDPELMKYPILYLSEPGCWYPSDTDVKALRKYLLKGGFFIVDDFMLLRRGIAENLIISRRVFEMQMRRILPEGQLVPIDAADPIFNIFYRVDPHSDFPPLVIGMLPKFYGIYEDNDPDKRLMVVASYNNDLSEYWLWSARGFEPIAGTGPAYKMGVNYLLYGMTH